jgi:transposase
MDSPMANSKPKGITRQRRSFSEEFKQEAVQMLLDGHSAPSVAQRLGLSSPNVLYRWRRVERERDILKKALAILSRQV